MKGKAQLILTDPDSGRVIKHIDESNMVTNAVKRIFEIPHPAFAAGNSREHYSCLMPIYKDLVSGLVMLGENIKENADDFMIPLDSTIVGTAGIEYTGTLSTRGTLNKSQSGEIDNGYRFVWDFAPEKAVGTIRCIGLTNKRFGNSSFDRTEINGSILVDPFNSNNGTAMYATTCFVANYMPMGRFDEDKSVVYSTSFTGDTVSIYRYKMPDCEKIKLGDTLNHFTSMTLLREDKYKLPFTPSSGTSWTIDRSTGLMYVFSVSYSFYEAIERVKYCSLNVKTGEIKREGEFSLMPKRYTGATSFAVYGNKIYISETAEWREFDLNGNETDSFEYENVNGVRMMFLNGKGYAAINDTKVNAPFLTTLSRNPKSYFPADYWYQSDTTKMPYVFMYNISDSYFQAQVKLMLRTDYLATINNLAEPLVKTDRHALQVRYEITDD